MKEDSLSTSDATLDIVRSRVLTSELVNELNQRGVDVAYHGRMRHDAESTAKLANPSSIRGVLRAHLEKCIASGKDVEITFDVYNDSKASIHADLRLEQNDNEVITIRITYIQVYQRAEFVFWSKKRR